MNGFLLSAGILVLFAFTIHALIGDKEYRLLYPSDNSSDKSKDVWVQARSGWHWVSVDLLLTGILLILLATTDFIAAQKEITFLLFLYFLVTGLVWFMTVFLSRSSNKQIFSLGQWLFCFMTSTLTYLGWLEL